jgi:hypothetical protein
MSQLEDTVRDLTFAVRNLVERLDRIEKQFAVNSDKVLIQCGESSITLTKTDVKVRAEIIDVMAERDAQIKAGGKLSLKGSRIIEN